MFAVVRFIQSDEIEVTSASWLREDDKKCLWPPAKTAQQQIRAIGSHEVPKSTWEMHDVLVIGNRKFRSYEESIAYLKRAVIESEPAFEKNDGRLRSRPPKPSKSNISNKIENKEQTINSDSEKNDERAVLPTAVLPNCPFTLNLAKQNISNKDQEEKANEEQTITIYTDVDSSPDQIIGKIIPSASGIKFVPILQTQQSAKGLPLQSQKVQNIPSKVVIPSELTEIGFKDWVVRNIKGLNAQNKEILEALDIIQRMLATKDSALGLLEDDPFDGIIPAQDSLVVQELEILCQVKSTRDKLIQRLSRGGGTETPKCCKRVVAKLISDQLASQYNWIRSRGSKESFKNSWMKNIIPESVRMNPATRNTTDEQIEDVLKEWLKTAAKRLKSVQANNREGQNEDQDPE